jgi:hypothetical protein
MYDKNKIVKEKLQINKIVKEKLQTLNLNTFKFLSGSNSVYNLDNFYNNYEKCIKAIP